LECKLIQTVELPSNNWFIGEIIESYTEETYLTDGKPDIKKMDPMVLTMPDNVYRRIGSNVAKAWSVGKKLKET
jgi:flavin reductase (DIM6/NTAB) family NADH-FMN oxidoreductase RutF